MNDYLASLGTEQVNPKSAELDSMEGAQIAAVMNETDATIAQCVAEAIPQIGLAIDEIALRLCAGGRLFYTGAGTSGRLGVLDASECPPTFGVPASMVQGIIAGGDVALRSAIEDAEDDEAMGARDLQRHGVTKRDVVVAISASGFALYCIGGLRYAGGLGALTISLCCNKNAALSKEAQIPIELSTGPEVLMGSTRLRAGTATKMVLNMLTTGAMVRMGKVYGNLMVDLDATNAKLRDRAIRIVIHALGIEPGEARALLQSANNSIKAAIVMHKTGVDRARAFAALDAHEGYVRRAIEALLSQEGKQEETEAGRDRNANPSV